MLKRQSAQIATVVVKIANGFLFMALPIHVRRRAGADPGAFDASHRDKATWRYVADKLAEHATVATVAATCGNRRVKSFPCT